MTQPVSQTALAALGAARMTSQVSQATSTAIVALWRLINPYDPGAVARFAAQAGRLLVPAQRTVANAHVGAQQMQLRALGINQPVTVTIPDNVRGESVTFGKTPKVHAPAKQELQYQEPAGDVSRTVTKGEATPGRLMERAAETYRYERSIGTEHDAANVAAEVRIETLVNDNMLLSARMASQQTLKLVSDKDSRVIGYRRIIHPERSKGGVCGMCVAAADRRYTIGDLQPIHTRCECTVSPIVEQDGEVIDPGYALHLEDLENLYAHARETAPTEDVVDRRTGEVIGTRKALGTSAKALKKTRYQIVDHGELGPVLTRVTGEQVPYFTTAVA